MNKKKMKKFGGELREWSNALKELSWSFEVWADYFEEVKQKPICTCHDGPEAVADSPGMAEEPEYVGPPIFHSRYTLEDLNRAKYAPGVADETDLTPEEEDELISQAQQILIQREYAKTAYAPWTGTSYYKTMKENTRG